MHASHVHDEPLDESGAHARQRPEPVVGNEPAVARRADPRLANTGSATTGLMALQRSAGNAAVASLVAGRAPVQRAVTIDEMSVETPTMPDGSPASAQDAGAGPVSAAGTGAPVTSDGSNTTINGGHITLGAPITESAGVIRADTIIANSVVASNYTPGAGNEW